MIKIFNREEQYLYEVEPIDSTHKEVLNGEETLELELDSNCEIEKYYRIVFKDKKEWKEFIVQEIGEDTGEKTRSVFCEASFYETFGDFIEEVKIYNDTADIALKRALENTRWEVGTIGALGFNSIQFYRISVKEAIHKIVDVYKGELKTRIEISNNKISHRFIDILSRRGTFKGERFVTGENLASVKRTVHAEPVVTALYGYGKGEEVGEGYGRRIDFSEINNGKPYVEDLTALAVWGIPDGQGGKKHIFGKVEFEEIESKNDLLKATREKLEELSKPRITYESEVLLAEAELGDTVCIIDKTFTPEIRLMARVYELSKSLNTPGLTNCVLDNYINTVVDSINAQEKVLNAFKEKATVWDGAEERVRTSFEEKLTEATDMILGTMNNSYVIYDGNQILVLDSLPKEHAKNVIRITSGGIGFSRTGIDGPFNSAWTIDGTLNMQNINVLGLEVGKNVTMGPDATITWAQLPYNVATTDNQVQPWQVTEITQNAIATEKLKLGGKIYRVIGDNWWNSAEHLLLGVNDFNNLQVGSPSDAAAYENTNIYAKGAIFLCPGGGTVSDTKRRTKIDSSGDIHVSGTVYSYERALALENHSHSEYIGFGDNAYLSKVFLSNADTATSGGANARIATGAPHQILYAAGSSRKWKHDIKLVENEELNPEKLYELPVVQFKYNDDLINPSDPRFGIDCIGFIAEDVAKIYPMAAELETGTPTNWDARYLIPGMLKLIQDQKKEIDEIKLKLEEVIKPT